MDELTETLQSAFESAGHEVGEVTVNRDTVRVAVREDEASASALRAVTTDAVDEDDILGLDVTTETGGDGETVSTVVSFRYRG